MTHDALRMTPPAPRMTHDASRMTPPGALLMTPHASPMSLQDMELDLLCDGIFHHYGFDFREYSRSSLRRRVNKLMRLEHVQSISALQEKVLHQPNMMERFLLNLSINVTAMFRDPEVYRTFREKVIPILRTYPFLRIWHAGCSTGEEVYSMAILLHEEGLAEKTKIYATDMNEVVLRKAKAGIFPQESMREYTRNYLKAGGTRSFSEYYTAKYDHAIFRPELRKNMVFSRHNLATDQSFNEFNVILCRNVMIYFNDALQNRVHDLFYDSLCRLGILVLGAKESIQYTPMAEKYEMLDRPQKIYRRWA